MVQIIRQLHGINSLDISGEVSTSYDLKFGHLWVEDRRSGRQQKMLSCSCGMTPNYDSRELIEIPLVSSSGKILANPAGVQRFSHFGGTTSTTAENCRILDGYFVKSKMLETALEVSASLSSIGMAVEVSI